MAKAQDAKKAVKKNRQKQPKRKSKKNKKRKTEKTIEKHPLWCFFVKIRNGNKENRN